MNNRLRARLRALDYKARKIASNRALVKKAITEIESRVATTEMERTWNAVQLEYFKRLLNRA